MTQSIAPKPPIVNVDGDVITIRIHSPAPITSMDELVHRGNCGIEARAFDTLDIPKRKLGRKIYARRSDLLALIDGKPGEVEPTDDLEAAVAKRARRAGR